MIMYSFVERKHSKQMHSRAQFDHVNYPTWKKYVSLSMYIQNMKVREKRAVFHVMRGAGVTHNTFLPAFGVTVGEFSTWQVLKHHPADDPVAEAPPRARKGAPARHSAH